MNGFYQFFLGLVGVLLKKSIRHPVHGDLFIVVEINPLHRNGTMNINTNWIKSLIGSGTSADQSRASLGQKERPQ